MLPFSLMSYIYNVCACVFARACARLRERQYVDKCECVSTFVCLFVWLKLIESNGK